MRRTCRRCARPRRWWRPLAPLSGLCARCAMEQAYDIPYFRDAADRDRQLGVVRERTVCRVGRQLQQYREGRWTKW